MHNVGMFPAKRLKSEQCPGQERTDGEQLRMCTNLQFQASLYHLAALHV